MVLLMLAGLLFVQGADEQKIQKLVDQLGSTEFAEREAADAELRKIGPAAVPALKKALDDADAERAERARGILKAIERKPEAAKGERLVIVMKDASRGVTFRQKADGSIEVTAPETDEKTGKKVYKTWSADSIEDFKKKYPDVAKRIEIDQFEGGQSLQEFEKWWAEKKKKLEENPFDSEEMKKWFDEQRKKFGGDDDLQKMLEEQRQRLEEMMKTLEELRRGFGQNEAPPKPAPDGKIFGIRVAEISPTLRSQLDLKEGEGLQVEVVTAGTMAEKAGLKQHDLVVGLNGKPVTSDTWAFRKAIREAMSAESFELEIIRAGKRQKITVSGK